MRSFMMGFCSLLIVLPGAASAQNQNREQKPAKSVFQQVIPKPTGKNGYEELIYAGELAKQSELLARASEENATLTLKRQALNEPGIQRALAFLRAGLAKQTFSPRTEIDDETLLPEFALFRNLARLLAVEQYVRLADGNVGGAIDSLRDGLLLGYRTQTDTLISGLVGVAIDAVVMGRFIRHIEQCSVRDCNRLLQVTGQWLEAPSPLVAVMESERAGIQRILQKYKNDPKGLLPLIRGAADIESDTEPSALEKLLEADSPNLASVIEGASALLMQSHDSILANLRRPAWERKPIPRPDEKTPTGQLANSLLVDPSRVVDRYETERASIRLLGVHAAIRRYRWEHDRLPDTLQDLRLDKPFLLDPFTGETLIYRREGETYELYSAGPEARGEDGKPIPGKRAPVYLPFRAR